MKYRPLILCLFFPLILVAGELETRFPELHNAGVVLIDTQGQILLASQAEEAFIPASTTKLVTAWLALNHWGEDHHFNTEFYLDASTQTLWVKGSGDPFLVSEEIHQIAINLKQLGLKNINAIGVDNTLFQSDLSVPGAGVTDNPYDAVPTAVAANFNTVAMKKISGKILSAEAQTPLTSFAKSLASQHVLSKDTLRINTGTSSHDAEQYFAELLAVFLRAEGITVGDDVVWGKSPQQGVYYTHINSKNLAEVIKPMMKYSTNFIANQLVLMLSEKYFQRPANFLDVERYMEEQLQAKFNWKKINFEDGAGLSRNNQISPVQLTQLLEVFRPWKHLLPEVTPGIYAKSGTLNNVSTLAGYAIGDKQQWHAFALMMPQSVPYKRRNKIANTLFKPKP